MIKLLLSLIFLVLLAFAPLPLSANVGELPFNHEVLLLPKAGVYEAFSLGYRNALSELLWFKLNNYFGKHFNENRNYPWLSHMCTLIVRLDPRPVHTYEFCASMLAYEAKDAQGAIALLGDAIEAHPEHWKFRFLRGFFYSYLLKDKEKSLEDYKVVATLPNVPEGIQRVVAERSAHTIPELISNLEAVYNITQNQQIKDVLADKIKRARLTRDLEVLQKAQDEFSAKSGRPAKILQELLIAGLIPKIPMDPWGALYYLEDGSGKPKTHSNKEPLHFDEF